MIIFFRKVLFKGAISTSRARYITRCFRIKTCAKIKDMRDVLMNLSPTQNVKNKLLISFPSLQIFRRKYLYFEMFYERRNGNNAIAYI